MERMHGGSLSLRRSCALMGLERFSLYYKARPRDARELCEKLKTIAQRFKRFGYRRAHAFFKTPLVNTSSQIRNNDVFINTSPVHIIEIPIS